MHVGVDLGSGCEQIDGVFSNPGRSRHGVEHTTMLVRCSDKIVDDLFVDGLERWQRLVEMIKRRAINQRCSRMLGCSHIAGRHFADQREHGGSHQIWARWSEPNNVDSRQRRICHRSIMP